MTTHGFSKEQIAEFREHFTEVDTDKSGKVDAKELKAVMEKCGVEASDAQIKDLIKECGSSATELDFESFLNLMWKMQSGPSEKEVRNEMFTLLDDNMDGLVSLEELKAFFKKASTDTKGAVDVPSDELLRQMIAEISTDGVNVSFDDLVKVMDRLA